MHITKAHWDDEDGYDDLDDGEFKKEEDEEGDEDEDRLYACGFRTQILLGSDYFLVFGSPYMQKFVFVEKCVAVT